MNTTKCRACGAEIIFIKTIAGKTIPCNAEEHHYIPSHDGCSIFVNPDGTTERGYEIRTQIDGQRIGYTSHFATCPEADSFRKPRKKDRKRAMEASYG